MYSSLQEAAEAAGKGKMTILRAIRSGKLSAQKGDDGTYLIDPAELFRVYPKPSPKEKIETALSQGETGSDTGLIQARLALKDQEIELIRAERSREREQLESTIDDLRTRLDKESEERRRLTLMLTDQREKDEARRGGLFSSLKRAIR